MAISSGMAQADTPPPEGKRPFYINHYGCPTSYYLEKPEDYEEPYAVFAKADSLGKLTKEGRDVLHRLDMLRHDAKNRTGEITAEGKEAVREQMKQMIRQFPGMFTDSSYIDFRCSMQNQCIEMAGEAAVELARYCSSRWIKYRTSDRDRKWMNPRDKQLAEQRNNSLTTTRFARFAALNTNNTRLMEALFNDQNYVVANIDATALSQQLYILAEHMQHLASLASLTSLKEIFTTDELHRHWRRQNAWNYICYGNCTLSGGYQAYMQREPLWNMLHMGDSIMKLDVPVTHIRFTNSGVIMSLASLMELDDFGLATDNLDSLETMGWIDNKIAPFGGRIVMVHYRRDRNDSDQLVKVLLNGHEARLPFPTDCPPYYHWNDVKRYYLRKLYRYEKARQDDEE